MRETEKGRAGIHNPYIGLRTYEEADSAVFRGRRAATADLFRLIGENDVVVLHAESGEGKSSLLNAGLVPMLRGERFFPVKINFTEEEFAEETPDFNTIVYRRIQSAIAELGDPNISLTPGLGLPAVEKLNENAWWVLRTGRLTAYGAPLVPILIFDQFEEVFTRPSANSWTEEFFLWLSETLNDEMPRGVASAVREQIGEEAEFPKIPDRKRFKALFSLRTEYMGETDYWAIQRHHISVMKNSRYCLKPLTETEADEVLALQPAFTPEVREKIKRAICARPKGRSAGTLPVIPAMLLSVVSTAASSGIAEKGDALGELGGITDSGANIFISIVSRFYHKETDEAGIPPKVMRQIEDVLVDDKGKRVRIKADARELRKIDFEKRYKPLLEEKRLIKCTQIHGDEYVELVHDAIARVVSIDRADSAASKKKLGNLFIDILWGVIAVLFALACWEWIRSPFEDEYSYYYGGSMEKFILPWIKATVYAIYIWLTLRIAADKRLWIKVMIYALGFVVLSAIGYRFTAFSLIHHYARNPMNFVSEVSVCLPLFLIGLALAYRRRRWLAAAGWCVMFISFSAIFAYVALPFCIVAGTLLVFFVGSYIYKKDRNFWWIALLSIVAFLFLMQFQRIFLANKDISYYIILIICGLFLIGLLAGLAWPWQRSIRAALKYVASGKAFLTEKKVKSTFWLFISSLVIALCSVPGMRLVWWSFWLLPVGASILYAAFVNSDQKKKPGIWKGVGVVAASAFLVGVFQFIEYKTVYISVLWGVSLALMLVLMYPAVKTETDRTERLRIGGLITMGWGLGVILLPFLTLGYNFMSNNFRRDACPPVAVAEGLWLIPVKDGNLQGLMDRRGRTVIEPVYSGIWSGLADRYGRPDVDDYYGTYIPWRQSFLLESPDGFYTVWDVEDHLDEANAYTDEILTNSSYSSLVPLGRRIEARLARGEEIASLQRLVESTIEDQITEAYHYAFYFANSERQNEKSNKVINIFRKEDLHLLADAGPALQWLDLSLLPYASERFRKAVLEDVLPAFTYFPFSLREIMSPDFNTDLPEYKGMDFRSALSVSPEASPEDLVKYRLGEAYTMLGQIYLANGKYDDAVKYLSLALEKGKFNEPALVYLCMAQILNGDERDRRVIVKEIENGQNSLIRINDGLYYPDPDLEGNWKFLKYNTLYNCLGNAIASLKWRLPAKDYELLADTYSQVVRISGHGDWKTDNRFDYVQLVPGNDGEENYKYGIYLPGEGFNHIGRSIYYYVDSEGYSSQWFGMFSYPDSESTEFSDPILYVDFFDKTKGYIKNTATFRGGGLPEFIDEHYEYDHAWPFSEGLAAVEVDGLIGFIDTTGRMVIEPQFGVPYPKSRSVNGVMADLYESGGFRKPYFRDGVAPVYTPSLELIYIDRQGRRVSSP